jgi:hypothetical protein
VKREAALEFAEEKIVWSETQAGLKPVEPAVERVAVVRCERREGKDAGKKILSVIFGQ